MASKKLIGQNKLMAQDQTKKEALFNEVKGSLFEYLVAKEIAVAGQAELAFQQSLDQNYLAVLTQQDRMVRQFYPEMLPFLNKASSVTSQSLIQYLKEIPSTPRVVGKFSNSILLEELFEADMILTSVKGQLPVSLKLNKKNSFVNTKSGGIKSFFSQYFSFLDQSIQQKFNQFVDMEFNRMAYDLHALHDIEFPGHFHHWVSRDMSELPGELDLESRKVLKAYYARIACEMHKIFEAAFNIQETAFKNSLPVLMGFGNSTILQVICFHAFPDEQDPTIEIHAFNQVLSKLNNIKIKPFTTISSVEIDIGNWTLQIRVKPMNKFTTTAMKINCSVKVRPPSSSSN